MPRPDSVALHFTGFDPVIDCLLARPVLGMDAGIDHQPDKAKKALGDKFSFYQFHNAVLGTGTVPLEILERQVDAYIRAAGG